MPIRRVTKRFHREVVIVPHALGRIHPHSLRINPLALRIKHGAIIKMKHAAADKNRTDRIVGELDGTKNRFRLTDGVIIQQQHEIAVPSFRRFVHTSREAAGTT